MKKIASIVLALVLVLAMAAPAMAETVDNQTNGHSYDVYQVFSGTQTNIDGDIKLGDIEWGSGVDGDALLTTLIKDYTWFDECTTAADVAEVLKNLDDECPEAKALANAAAKNLKTSCANITADAESVVLDPGYYLLIDTTDVNDKEDAKNTALLQVTKRGDVQIKTKYSVPQVDKKIVEGEDEVTATNVSIGDSVTFELTGTLPSNFEDYDFYKYVFHDTLSEGLTYNEDAKVYVVNEVTVDGETTTTKVEITDSFGITHDNGTLTITCNDLQKVEGVVAGSKIVVEYTATLNEKAVIGNPGNPNTVKLEFSNDPNFDADTDNDGEPDGELPTGKTPDKTVVVYTTGIELEKTDGTNKLTGAKFQISGETLKVVIINEKIYEVDAEGTYYRLKDGTYTETAPTAENAEAYEDTTTKYSLVEVVTKDTVATQIVTEAWVDADGILKFEGLGEGTYVIEELVAPQGYNLLKDEITIVITWDADNGFVAKKGDETLTAGEDNLFDLEVVNNAGTVLPETGGIGTTIFYVGGGLLIAAAVVLLVSKRKAEAK